MRHYFKMHFRFTHVVLHAKALPLDTQHNVCYTFGFYGFTNSADRVPVKVSFRRGWPKSTKQESSLSLDNMVLYLGFPMGSYCLDKLSVRVGRCVWNTRKVNFIKAKQDFFVKNRRKPNCNKVKLKNHVPLLDRLKSEDDVLEQITVTCYFTTLC